MRAFTTLLLRLRTLLCGDQVDRELDDELQHHIERQIEANLAAGMSSDEARYAALREFGGFEQRKEECRDARGLTLLDSVLKDFRYALRSLRRTPGFTIVAVLSLALGIGANTTIFTFLNAVLLRPLPYPQPDRIVVLREQALRQDATVLVHPLNFLEWRRRARSFEAIALMQSIPRNATGVDGGAEQVMEAQITSDLFRVFGIPPVLGRAFTEDETRRASFTAEGNPVAHSVVIVSHGYWQRRFGSDPGIVGKRLALTSGALTVVGVAAPGFRIGQVEPDLYTPLPIDPNKPDSIGSRSFQCYASLRAGVGLEAARAELTALASQLAREHPIDKGFGAAVFGLHDYLVKDGRRVLWLLMGAVAAVLLIACVNLAALLLARGIGRRSELALRASLGASRGRIARQLVIESLVLAGCGGAAGLLLGHWTTRALVTLTERTLTFGRTADVHFDATCLLFTCALVTATAVASGLFPAWQASRVDPVGALAERGRTATATRGQQRVRSLLVVAEVATAVVLLVGSGLLLRTFSRLTRVDLGFQPGGTITGSLFLGTDDGARRAGLVDQILDRVMSLPGVRAAGTIQFLPVTGVQSGTGFWREGAPPSDPSRSLPTAGSLVSRGYFEAMRIPVLQGRSFDRRDRLGSARVVIVNESFVRRYFPDGRAIGRHITVAWSNQAPTEIVGVVGNVRHNGLTAEPEPTVFLPHSQAPGYITHLIVRSSGDPTLLATPIRRAVQQVDPAMAVSAVKTMEQYVDDSLAGPRLYAALVSAFAGLALSVAAIGIYGLIAYVVSQRTPEIGIRMVLGADRRAMFQRVFAQGALLALAGLAVGVVVALAVGRVISTLLFGITATDPVTYVVAAATFAAVALTATAIPACRAARVDPITALRFE
jgi:predicted permease